MCFYINFLATQTKIKEEIHRSLFSPTPLLAPGPAPLLSTPRCCCLVVVSNSFVTPWTVACLAPLSMGFLRQEYRVGCDVLLQEIFPTQGSNPCLLCLLP